MLYLTIPEQESWDAQNRVFVTQKATTLQLEHSLVSLSKWESKWCKPFLSKEDKTDEELVDYIKCMTITQNVSPDVYARIASSGELITTIQNYINASMTATTFSVEDKGKGRREVVTSEIIYYWMISFNIPVKFETWHLNRLLTLIRVCSIKNASPKKQSKKDIMSRQAALNAARKKRLSTRG
jgi:hypothetical protein